MNTTSTTRPAATPAEEQAILGDIQGGLNFHNCPSQQFEQWVPRLRPHLALQEDGTDADGKPRWRPVVVGKDGQPRLRPCTSERHKMVEFTVADLVYEQCRMVKGDFYGRTFPWQPV
jgi:hypothetical protein